MKSGKPNKLVTPEAARLKMAGLCANAEHSEHEIREKLRKMMLPANEIQPIIDFLTDGKFIDNARFARSFANDKIRFAGWGRNKIKQALYMKRIPSEIISQVCADIDLKEYAAAIRRVAIAKSKTLDLKKYEDRNKLFKYLVSRGYEPSICSKLISSIK